LDEKNKTEKKDLIAQNKKKAEEEVLYY